MNFFLETTKSTRGILPARPPAGLHLLEKLTILRVRANPEPHDGISLPDAEGAPADADTDRIRLLFPPDLLELQAGVIGVLLPELVIPPGALPDPPGQTLEVL